MSTESTMCTVALEVRTSPQTTVELSLTLKLSPDQAVVSVLLASVGYEPLASFSGGSGWPTTW